MSVDTGGPYLAAALLCEKVLHEKDGILSAIRIVDRMIVTSQGPQPPEQLPSVLIKVNALLIFKSGAAKGSHTVKIQPVAPSDFKSPAISLPMFLEGENRGASLVCEIAFQATQEGVYWFDVLIKDDLLTRMPLQVVYQRMETGQSGGTPVH
jgi:hypothetical protein